MPEHKEIQINRVIEINIDRIKKQKSKSITLSWIELATINRTRAISSNYRKSPRHQLDWGLKCLLKDLLIKP